MDLKSSQFRREREAAWRELDELVRRIESGGTNKLTTFELSRLPGLYHSAISSLSVARAISLDKNLLDYLENLAGRAYISVYGTKRSVAEAVIEFVVRSFPRAVRRYWKELAASVGILVVGVLTGYFLVAADEDRYYDIVPEGVHTGRTPMSTTEELRDILYSVPETDRVGDTLNLFASFLFTHNAKIGILCFALGFAAGAPVVFLLFVNGLYLGAMGGLYANRGLGGEFWAWVMPHGVTEFGAVALCGMAGMVVGLSLVFPGQHRRLDLVATRGREVAMVVIGSVALFFIAALIEGFFRQLVHDVTVRWIIAASTLAGWTLYFVLSGRER
jgi:uncharacterized membrane protein SpoIIM required for sporulation